SKNPKAEYMLIGSLWLPTSCREKFKKDIHDLRNKHKIGGEFKWQKVSPARINFYKELIGWFNAMGNQLRYRCIVVEHNQVDLKLYHNNDQELGFYKFYYQLLHHWIYDFNEYCIFVDYKANRNRRALLDLRRCLSCSNLSSMVKQVQAVHSNESVLIQLTDVLTGTAAYRLNKSVTPNSAKFELLCKLEELLGYQIKPTYKNEQKFNVFKINLTGGW
ncbi:unnamed protein product, partial [marine sediment metagenome]